MEVKKKRWRPSVTEYRKLEKERDELLQHKEVSDNEIKRLWHIIEEQKETIDSLDAEVYELCHRGLWARIFNL